VAAAPKRWKRRTSAKASKKNNAHLIQKRRRCGIAAAAFLCPERQKMCKKWIFDATANKSWLKSMK
jgi:hypothetical protein